MLMYVYVYMYVFMLLSDRVIRDHYYGWMIAYVGEWHEEFPSIDGEKYPWQIYEVSIMWIWIDIICLYYAYVYSMVGNVEGNISRMKNVWSAACWDKHG